MFERKYSLDEVSIVPKTDSCINHRRTCLVVDKQWKLPIFTSPMPTVVNKDTLETYERANICHILPRTEDINDRLENSKKNWSAFSLSEFQEHFCVDKMLRNKHNIVIDMANGHMKALHDLVSVAKTRNGNILKIMVGNIANPKTYDKLCDCGADYVRLSIGTGSVATTTHNTGIFYPTASLIKECREIKEERLKNGKPVANIVADGGFDNYGQIIKALALGADYVMLGKLLNMCSDSAGAVVKHEDVDMKLYYGVSSEEGQKDFNKILTVSEGKLENNVIGVTVKEFAHDFIGYLQSAMSYCNVNKLDDFIGKQDFVIIDKK